MGSYVSVTHTIIHTNTMRLLIPSLCILLVIVTIQASFATQSDTELTENEIFGREVREAGRKEKRIAKGKSNVKKRKFRKTKKGHNKIKKISKKSKKNIKSRGTKRNNANQSLTKKAKTSKKSLSRAVTKGVNCDFIDMLALPCQDGEKFVFKGSRGPPKVRRQFLVLSSRKIVAFLELGKKITNCVTLNNITGQVTCKAIPGAATIDLITKQTGGAVTPTTNSTSLCPCSATDSTATVTSVTCAAGMSSIVSNGYSHSVTCGSVSQTLNCGGALKGTKDLGLGITFDYNQPLCTNQTITSPLHSVVWQCNDVTYNTCSLCPGVTLPMVPCTPLTNAPTTPLVTQAPRVNRLKQLKQRLLHQH